MSEQQGKFQHKPGTFTVFYFEPKDSNGQPREKKETDPTLTGSGLDKHEQPFDIAIYKNVARDGKTIYFKGVVSEPYKKEEKASAAPAAGNVPI